MPGIFLTANEFALIGSFFLLKLRAISRLAAAAAAVTYRSMLPCRCFAKHDLAPEFEQKGVGSRRGEITAQGGGMVRRFRR